MKNRTEFLCCYVCGCFASLAHDMTQNLHIQGCAYFWTTECNEGTESGHSLRPAPTAAMRRYCIFAKSHEGPKADLRNN